MESSDSEDETKPILEHTTQGPWEQILAFKYDEEGDVEFFVKQRGKSFRECQWVTHNEFISHPNSTQMASRYLKKNRIPQDPPYFDPSYTDIDRIIDQDASEVPTKYFVKWQNLGYECSTWETDVDQEEVDKYLARSQPFQRSNPTERPQQDQWVKLEEQHDYQNDLSLFQYQFDGLNWLVFCWYCRRNCILADEMGLGKTIQAVAFIDHLNRFESYNGPFLVVAPLATLPHWQRQFEAWTTMNTIVYSGTKEGRQMIQQYEFYFEDTQDPKFNVLITSYEVLMNDLQLFAGFTWEVLIVDEAHRLKNANSKLLRSLSQTTSHHRILLTGTPLQNTIEELQSLLEFLHPGQFSDVINIKDASDIQKLRKRLKPHMLRRMKVDVDQSIAAKEETIIECAMTKHQKAFYKAILENYSGFLTTGSNLANVAMELRKVCLHPYLIKGAETKILNESEQQLTNELVLDMLIRSSGKMILIHKLLPKLKTDGHRVLIFSQMTNLLDILQDYLTSVGYKFLRIDGQVRGSVRQQLIDRFNAPDSDIFIFLLCTRAGGLGINLNTADTVIIFDSDWNPQNDLQAQARCHRIGQRKVVKVYRLITKGTYEQRMFEIASRKLGLGYAVLDQSKGKELDKLLRQGAYHAFNDVEEENFGEEDIDQILSRAKVMVINDATDSSFSKASFDVDDESVDIDDPDFWNKLLPHNVDTCEEEADPFDGGRMKTRRRTAPSFIEDDTPIDDGTAREWKRVEREKLQRLLSWFGWGRWNDAEKLIGLKRSVLEIKLAARAFLRWMLNHHTDLSQFTVARTLLAEANTEKFDPSFITEDEALAQDTEFMRQSVMLDPEFISLFQKKGVAWLRRIELLHFIIAAVEKADHKISDLVIPTCQGNLPTPTWTIDDDRALIYGTYKHGFARYEEMIEDSEINFSFSGDIPQNLTPRIKKLSAGVKKILSDDSHPIATQSYIATRPKAKLWRKKDKSTVLQLLLKSGVPLQQGGEYDWDLFRDQCGFADKTNDQVAKFVDEMMDAQNEETLTITAQRITQRLNSLTRLRRVFLKISEDHLKEYFSYLPRWRNVPRDWTNLMEYHFFREIKEQGWGSCGDILKMSFFEGVFDKAPPAFLTSDNRIIRRLQFVLDYIEEHKLEELREKEASKPKRKAPSVKQYDLLPIPDNPTDEHGLPTFPINLTSSSCIMDLGTIITDRTGFHTERYVYPAGFKSSRMYTSTLDPTKRVRYICEILDVGDQMPLFRVSMEDNPDVKYEGNSPTSPWNLILKRVLELRADNNPPKTLSISGPEYYGLAAPVTLYFIQKMPNVDKCVNYVPRQFAPETPKPILPPPTEEPRTGAFQAPSIYSLLSHENR